MTELIKIKAENTTSSTIEDRLDRMRFLTNGIELLSGAIYSGDIENNDIDGAALAIKAMAWEANVECIAIEEALHSYKAQ